MDKNVSSRHAALRVHHDETLPVAALLAFAGGYLDAYSWIVHSIFANAQTANLVLLWIHTTAGRWANALHYFPPLIAFVIGVIMASCFRRAARSQAGPISILIEIAFLVLVAILHNRLPDVAGTLGISFVASMQAASFPRVEEWNYSSVMATTNLRQTIEGLFVALSGCVDPRPFRRPMVFATILAAFGAGAAMGAFVT